MPRTKKPQRIPKTKIIPKVIPSNFNDERAIFEELILQQNEEQKKDYLLKYEEMLKNLDLIFKSQLFGLTTEYLNQPYEEFFKDKFGKDEKLINPLEKNNIYDDKPVPVKRSKRTITKKTTTLDNGNPPPPSTASVPHFLTPATTQSGKLNPITPKIEPNTALTVLRHPRHGEIGISINGSPLLVSSNHNHDLANVNIPLQDGNIISLIGQAGNVNFKNVNIDKKTKEQLKIIQRNLDIILEEQ